MKSKTAKILPFSKPEPVIDSDYFGSETLPITDLLQALDEVKRRKQEAFNDANIIILISSFNPNKRHLMTLTLSYDTKTRKYYLAELLEGNEIRLIEELGYKYNPALREFNKILREL